MNKETKLVFTAYREYGTAKREALCTAAAALLGGFITGGVVIMGADRPAVMISAVIGLAILLVLHIRMIRQKTAARSRLDAILSKCLASRSKVI